LIPRPDVTATRGGKGKPSLASAWSFVSTRTTETLFFHVFFTIPSPTFQAVP
jgi:hypothetical protein